MPRASFKGDRESHLNELILASQKPQVSNTVLKERTLVPYFDAPADALLSKPLENNKKGNKNSTNTKQQQTTNNSGKPPKAQKPKQTKSVNANATIAVTQQQQPKKNDKSRKHNRDPSHKNLSELGAANTNNNLSSSALTAQAGKPPRKRQEHYYNEHGNGDPASLMGPAMHAAPFPPTAPALPAAPRFAGPAFTLSPTPDTLPIPTSFLMAEVAADRMRSGLVL